MKEKFELATLEIIEIENDKILTVSLGDDLIGVQDHDQDVLDGLIGLTSK